MKDGLFRTIKAVIGCYFGIAVIGFAITFLLRGDPQLVNQAVWVRDCFTLASATILYLLATFASRGDRFAFTRVRIVSVIVPLTIVALIVLPDPFPQWMKVQQGLGALAVVAVAVIVNRRSAGAQLAR